MVTRLLIKDLGMFVCTAGQRLIGHKPQHHSMACSCVKLVPGVRCVYNWAWHGVGLNLFYIYGRGVCPSACNSIHIGLMLDYTCAWNGRSMHESAIPFLTRYALSIVSD